MRALSIFAALTATFCASAASAQYTPAAGRSAPAVQEKRQVRDESTGAVKEETVQVRPKSDQYGNAQGNQFDLAVDGAFSGQTIAGQGGLTRPAQPCEHPRMTSDTWGQV